MNLVIYILHPIKKLSLPNCFCCIEVDAKYIHFFLLEIPILISAMGVPGEALDPQGGSWHEPWSPDQQSKWISRMFGVFLSKPFVETLFWTDLYDHPHANLPGAGLISDTGKTKPALQRLVSLRRHLRKPLGPLKLPFKAATTEVSEP